uniref:Uncharacterized protein n=1 Tax=viral metagenome TaxID=1070528 RepID=A0A6M3JEV7_9ZZZZ
MSDRWGPSETCIECGEAVSAIDLQECPACQHVMCTWCVDRSYHPCDLYLAQAECVEHPSKKNLQRYLRARR